VTGPTGSGKSAFAVALAERIRGEIVGADAFQIFSGLPILTAQPPPELLSRVPHHLIGELSPDTSLDAAKYAVLARVRIAEISARGRTPLIVGGTGLYIKALTHGLADMAPVAPTLRQEIAKLSLPEALERLAKADPAAPAQIDRQNPVRVRRALEIVLSTGLPLAVHRQNWTSQPDPAFRGIVLARSRPELRARIAANVEAMFATGVVAEVRANAPRCGPSLSRAIGFQDIQRLIAGECDEPACRAAITTATCQYAKRQETWFRNQFAFPEIIPANANSPEQMTDLACEILAQQASP